MKGVNIQIADGNTFRVDWDVARQSQTIRRKLDELLIEEDSNEEITIPIFHEAVTGPVFKKALACMEENRGKPNFQEDDHRIEGRAGIEWNVNQLNEWEKQLIEIPVAEMTPLWNCANVLEIQGLISLMISIELMVQNEMEKRRNENFPKL